MPLSSQMTLSDGTHPWRNNTNHPEMNYLKKTKKRQKSSPACLEVSGETSDCYELVCGYNKIMIQPGQKEKNLLDWLNKTSSLNLILQFSGSWDLRMRNLQEPHSGGGLLSPSSRETINTQVMVGVACDDPSTTTMNQPTHVRIPLPYRGVSLSLNVRETTNTQVQWVWLVMPPLRLHWHNLHTCTSLYPMEEGHHHHLAAEWLATHRLWWVWLVPLLPRSLWFNHMCRPLHHWSAVFTQPIIQCLQNYQ